MHIRYRISFDDYVEAQRAHRKVSRAERWALRLLIAVCLLLMALAIFVSVVKPALAAVMWWLLLPYAVWVGLLLYGRPLWALKFRGIRNIQRDFEVEIKEEKVSISSDIAHGETKWEGFVNWFESKNLFLLYQQPALFNVLPKRTFPPGEVEQLRELLSRKVPQKL